MHPLDPPLRVGSNISCGGGGNTAMSRSEKVTERAGGGGGKFVIHIIMCLTTPSYLFFFKFPPFRHSHYGVGVASRCTSVVTSKNKIKQMFRYRRGGSTTIFKI